MGEPELPPRFPRPYIYICLCPTQSLDPTCTQCNVLQKVPSWAPCRASAFGPSRTSGNSEIYRIWKSGMWQKSKEIIRKSKSEFVAPRTYVTYEVQREQTFFKAPCMGQVYMHWEMHAGSSCLGFQGLQAAVYIYMRASVCKHRAIAVASRTHGAFGMTFSSQTMYSFKRKLSAWK